MRLFNPLTMVLGGLAIPACTTQAFPPGGNSDLAADLPVSDWLWISGGMICVLCAIVACVVAERACEPELEEKENRYTA